ncbi:phosphotriesterase [Streptomyces sp. H10-C2]|uniref:phosphotriesterase family protein n=1 Tax=unclassified Streptomyces TaxID=2593676 RepID=UPI0024B90F6E|nr:MULTISPECIES: phosphotriesterase [unclassified Streptomyces]MDJ0344158.1 phosphotriesterase [Streptomyces sp. PH10-H1]MDJ0373083.1 phosphotriesterase [Streptomyces sp. H10-C2]
MSAIRTVLGDIPPERLGVTDAHDHLFFRIPALAGQELDSPGAAEAELLAFRELGGRTVTQWTPFGLGRHAGDLPAVSRASSVHVVAATGLHQAVHYQPKELDRLRGRTAEFFVSELTEGLRPGDDPDAPPGTARAGMIKVAGGFHGLDAHARHVMTAAAHAHHATDAPIGVHLELGTGALDVLDLLCGKLDVSPERVLLGHLNRSPDLRIHRAAAEAGAFLVYDGPSRANHATDWRLFDALATLTEAGHAAQLLLGGDTTTAAARSATGGGPGMPFLLSGLRPRLARELGEAVTEQIYVANPARALAVDWP